MKIVIDDEKIIDLLEMEWGYEGIREDITRVIRENGIPLEDIKAEIEKEMNFVPQSRLDEEYQHGLIIALYIINKHIGGKDEEKSGYWLYVGNEKFDKWKCDQCSHEVNKCQTPCPNCGAKMIGAKV